MSNERERPEFLGTGPDPHSDDFATGTAVAEGHVEVIHGVYAHSFPIAGMTVAQAREELAERLNIPPDAVAVVNGNQVSDDAVLHERNVVNFVKPAGEKGGPVAMPQPGNTGGWRATESPVMFRFAEVGHE